MSMDEYKFYYYSRAEGLIHPNGVVVVERQEVLLGWNQAYVRMYLLSTLLRNMWIIAGKQLFKEFSKLAVDQWF